MKIVINIPEQYLNSNIIDVTLFTGTNNTITDVNIENEYAEFQILPEGHGDLIDKNELLHQFRYDDEWYKGGTMKKIIECTAPVVIPADNSEVDRYETNTM